MKERFEKRRLFGTLNVACKYEDGTVRYWQAQKETVVKQIVTIVEAYAAMGHRLTLRQLHYQFVSRNWIVNHDTAYKKLGKILDDCRYGGIIDWDLIEDRGRRPWILRDFDNVRHSLTWLNSMYRVNRQQGQDSHIEIWTEKDALSGIMQGPAAKYQIPLIVNKGYTSSSAIYTAYQRLAEKMICGQDVKILYFGDHDPSGLDMIRDIRERLEFMFAKGTSGAPWRNFFNVIPIGLNKKQIKQYKCPPNPTKMTDSRSSAYIAEHGKTCWEVDALAPDVLVGILETNIQAHLDQDLFNEQLERERKDIKTLSNFIKKAK